MATKKGGAPCASTMEMGSRLRERGEKRGNKGTTRDVRDTRGAAMKKGHPHDPLGDTRSTKDTTTA
jgi:hypothetical protein